MDFRKVKRDDWEFILELRNSLFKNFHKQNSPIKLKEHEKYMKTQVKNEKKWKKEISELRKNALSASKLLKVNNTDFYDFPDNALDSIPLLKIINRSFS